MHNKYAIAAISSGLLLHLLTTAYATDASATILATYPTDTSVGESFVVEISIEENTGFGALQFTLQYDPTVLTCTAVDTGAALQGMLTATNPSASDGARLVGASATNVTATDTVGTFTFTVVQEGDYAFALADVLLAQADGSALEVTVNGVPVAMEQSALAEEAQGETAPQDSLLQSSTQNSAQTTTTSDQAQVSTPDDDPLFTDTIGHWAQAEIANAAELGLMEGYGDGIFGADDPLTRGQLVTILWRNANSPTMETAASFTDLDPNTAYYQQPIAWAEQTGVVQGYGDGLFGPEDNVTREQLATVLYRLAGEPLDGAQAYTGIYNAALTDAENVSASLQNAVYWAVYHEIWCGTDSTAIGTTLAPTAAATRAQVAVMLSGFDQYNKEEST